MIIDLTAEGPVTLPKTDVSKIKSQLPVFHVEDFCVANFYSEKPRQVISGEVEYEVYTATFDDPPYELYFGPK